VRQVGYLQGLYRDARSTERKMLKVVNILKVHRPGTRWRFIQISIDYCNW